jgi:UDP-glucose 4-epimerase
MSSTNSAMSKSYIKKCLVSGGAGFIGSHVVDRLVTDGHDVTVLDNLETGRRENLLHLRDHPRLRVIHSDVTNNDAYRSRLEGVEWLFHLAARADIVPSIQRPSEYHRTNVDGTVSILEAARAAGVKRFVYAASSSCYGIPDIYPTPETAPIRPQYPYALTKFLGEQCVLHWGQVYKLPVVSLRFFNVYGPRARTSGAYGAVFGVFLAQKLAGRPATVVGDGTQTRDFIFVTDVVDAMVKAAQSDLAGVVLNVGSGDTYSINRLVDLLGIDKGYLPKRPGEPDCTLADITKIRRLLDWEPKVSFEDGVRIMVDNIDYWRQAPVWTPEKIADATQEWFTYLKDSSN